MEEQQLRRRLVVGYLEQVLCFGPSSQLWLCPLENRHFQNLASMPGDAKLLWVD